MNASEVLSVGAAAEICGVSNRTIAKWIDSGELRGYRLPGGNHRRVIRRNLIEFMQTHGLGDLVPGASGVDESDSN